MEFKLVVSCSHRYFAKNMPCLIQALKEEIYIRMSLKVGNSFNLITGLTLAHVSVMVTCNISSSFTFQSPEYEDP